MPEATARELIELFARLQTILLGNDTAPTLVTQLARLSQHLVPGADGAGVALLEPGGEQLTTAVTDPALETVENLQHDIDEGPHYSAWATATTQRIEDTATDPRWPGWSAAALRLGIRSMLSTPLMSGSEAVGVLTVYATTAHAFSAEDERTLGLLAAAVAALLGAGRTSQGPPVISNALRAVFTDRQAVDIATGILMERHHLPRPQAQQRLHETAAAGGHPPAEAARRLIAEAS